MVLSDADLAKIRAAIADINRAVQRRDRIVRAARDRGATWTELGFALGITAQGAQKRYGTGPERSAAHAEKSAERAIKRRQKAAKKASVPRETRGVDPWPDGTVQGTMGD